jgi:PAS domain S-box-containing protein
VIRDAKPSLDASPRSARSDSVVTELRRFFLAAGIAVVTISATTWGVFVARAHGSAWFERIGIAGIIGELVLLWLMTSNIRRRVIVQASNLSIQEERYRLTSRSTDDLIWDWDIPASQVTVSNAIQRLFGYSEDPVVPLDWWREHIHPDDLSRVLESIDRTLAGRETRWGSDYRLRRADGSYADVSSRGFVVRASTGAPVRMVGSLHSSSRSCDRRRRWKRWVSSPAASHTTSTTFSRRSRAMRSFCWRTFRRPIRDIAMSGRSREPRTVPPS